MSVINSMLRDLDRRHAPLPVKSNVQPTSAQNQRVLPRSAMALCALLVLAIWNWNHATKKITNVDMVTPAATLSTQPATGVAATIASPQAPTPEVISTLKANAVSTKIDNALPQATAAKKVEPSEKRQATLVAADKNATNVEAVPFVKQERKTADDINAERYQFARNALAQNQPERAYELLRDNPPPLASNSDYHAVLAAVEQQLGHYADASLHYQQLLSLDQNQASWWLGLALSFEGEHRNTDALTAYTRAATLNSLPDAARQYAFARIAALNHSAEQ